jgi:hypothetical protein
VNLPDHRKGRPLDPSHDFRPSTEAGIPVAELSGAWLAAEAGLDSDAERSRRLSRSIHRRARLDIVLVAGGSAGAAWLGSSPAESMMAALCALSLGILVYVIRRDRDLRRLAAHQSWRDRALAGKGVSLSDWRAGISPQPWPHRDSGAS